VSGIVLYELYSLFGADKDLSRGNTPDKWWKGIAGERAVRDFLNFLGQDKKW
jgi:hypothetical protein